MVEKLKGSIRKHPLAYYYAISVLIVVAIIPIFIFTGAQEGFETALKKTGIPFNTDLVTAFRLVVQAPESLLAVLLSILQVASPDIAVLIVAVCAYRRKGLLKLKHRFRFWKKGMDWQYALKVWGSCILVFSLMNLASGALNKLFISAKIFVWDINLLSFNFWLGFLIAMFLDGGAVFEENGWRGFALPILQRRFNPLKGTVILALLWSMWHIPVKFDLFFAYGIINFIFYFLVLTIKFIFLSIIMTYFFNKIGQSTIISIVMHGLSNDSLRLGGKVLDDSFQTSLITELNLVFPMYMVAMILIMETRGNLCFGLKKSRLALK